MNHRGKRTWLYSAFIRHRRLWRTRHTFWGQRSSCCLHTELEHKSSLIPYSQNINIKCDSLSCGLIMPVFIIWSYSPSLTPMMFKNCCFTCSMWIQAHSYIGVCLYDLCSMSVCELWMFTVVGKCLDWCSSLEPKAHFTLVQLAISYLTLSYRNSLPELLNIDTDKYLSITYNLFNQTII